MIIGMIKKSLLLFLVWVGLQTVVFADAPKLTRWLSIGEIAQLTASDPKENDKFGYSVAVSGTTFVVGIPGRNSVDVYEYNSYTENYLKAARLSADNISEDEKFSFFGRSVAIDGNIIVVGTNGKNAYLFEKPDGGWHDMNQTGLLRIFDTYAERHFGCSVAVSGDTIVVGADGDNDDLTHAGAAYLFEKPDDGWQDMFQTAKLTASDATENDRFGYSVAMDGDTIVVGAKDNSDSGSAYLFEKPSGGWHDMNQSAKLIASDASVNDEFGYSIAVHGDRVVVGAHLDDDGGVDTGSVYLFEKPAGGWRDMYQSAKFTASDATARDLFGNSVDISDEMIVIGRDSYGSDDPGKVYLFRKALILNAVENKTHIIDLNESVYDENPDTDFYLGGRMDGYLLTIDMFTGSLRFKTPPDYENPRDGDGDNIYQFILTLHGSNLEERRYHALVRVTDIRYEGQIPTHFEPLSKISASDPENDAYFGHSVAISGSTTVIGAYGSDGNKGCAYVYEYDTGTKSYRAVARLQPDEPSENDYFGYSVAVDGDMIVVGAYGDDNGAGAAYLFEKPSGGWTDMNQTVKLTASDAATDDHFGYSVAISGNTIVVGAYNDDIEGTDSGSVYVFKKSGDIGADMHQIAKLSASDIAAGDHFGYSVAISGNTIVVGARWHDDDGRTNVGGAYLFEKSAGEWNSMTQTAKLTASDAAAGDQFGTSVAIHGDTVVVGADHDDNGVLGAGSAYLFQKPAAGWNDMNQTAKLTASDPGKWDSFGTSVAINGDTVVVGTPFHDEGSISGTGSIYLFQKPADGWSDMTQTAKLTASDASEYDYFGAGGAIYGDTIVVGAHRDDEGGTDRGSAYLFKGNTSGINPGIIMYLLD